jgi:hypothetical protein
MTRRARDRVYRIRPGRGGDSEKSREGSNRWVGQGGAGDDIIVVDDHPASSDHPVNSALQHLLYGSLFVKKHGFRSLEHCSIRLDSRRAPECRKAQDRGHRCWSVRMSSSFVAES